LGIETTIRALTYYAEGKILFPDKVSQIFDQQTQNRINCLPATVIPDNVCGMKWVAVFPTNPIEYQLPNLNATILLSETITGYPIAFMDGTLCSDLRTASVSAVAAKYLARNDSEIIGFIGAGEQAKMHFLTLKTVLPLLKVCKIASRTSTSEHKFAEQMSAIFPDVEFVCCNSNYEMAAQNSDVIVTAISAQLPILQSEWLKEGVFYSHVGGWEDDFSVPLSVDKIVCDHWDSVKHRTQTISRLFQQGILKDSDIYADLHEIVAGSKKGREARNERIYFNAVGLSYVDVALAYQFYKLVINKGHGIDLKLNMRSLFEPKVDEI
jgi:ornithine cyclodeaminase/alanine dehydrogenase-like protein (mu-crystallin family)